MSLIDEQVDKILSAEEFEEEEFGCECIFLYAQMEQEPGGMPNPEFFGVGNIPLCDPCKAERKREA